MAVLPAAIISCHSRAAGTRALAPMKRGTAPSCKQTPADQLHKGAPGSKWACRHSAQSSALSRRAAPCLRMLRQAPAGPRRWVRRQPWCGSSACCACSACSSAAALPTPPGWPAAATSTAPPRHHAGGQWSAPRHFARAAQPLPLAPLTRLCLDLKLSQVPRLDWVRVQGHIPHLRSTGATRLSGMRGRPAGRGRQRAPGERHVLCLLPRGTFLEHRGPAGAVGPLGADRQACQKQQQREVGPAGKGAGQRQREAAACGGGGGGRAQRRGSTGVPEGDHAVAASAGEAERAQRKASGRVSVAKFAAERRAGLG